MRYKCTNIYECTEAAKLHLSPNKLYGDECRVCAGAEVIRDSTHQILLEACPICGAVSGKRAVGDDLEEYGRLYNKGFCRLCGCRFVAARALESDQVDLFRFVVEFVRLLLRHQEHNELCEALEQYSLADEHGDLKTFQQRIHMFLVEVMGDARKRAYIYRRIRKCEQDLEYSFLPPLM